MLRDVRQFLNNRFSKKNGFPLFDQALVTGGNFFTVLLGARYLTLADQGRLGYVFAGYYFLVIVNVVFLYQWGSVQAPQHPERANYRDALALGAVLFGGVGTIFIFFILFILASVSKWSFSLGETMIVLGFLFIQQLADFERRSSYIFVDSKRAMNSSAVVYIARTIGLLLFRPTSLYYFFMILLICAIPTACITLFRLGKSIKATKNSFSLLKQHMQGALWLGGSAPFIWLWGYIPMFVSGQVLGVEAVGGYVTVNSLTGAGNILMEIYDTEISVRAAQKKMEADRALYIYLSKITLLSLLFWAISFCGVIFLGREIIQIAFGQKYIAYFSVLVYLWVLLGIVILFRLGAVRLRTLGKPKLVFAGYFVSTCVIVLVTYPVIKSFGVNGIAYSLIIGAFANLITQQIYSKFTPSL